MQTSQQFSALRTAFQALLPQDKVSYINDLSPQEKFYFLTQPNLFLFDKQIVPDDGDWIFFLLQCGRSFGKSFAGGAWVSKKIRGGAKVIGLCGPTYDDVAKIMVPAIIKWFAPHELKDIPYNNQTHTLSFKNGATIHCYTSDKEIRGPNLEYLWADEISTWASGIDEKKKRHWEDLTRALRVGKHPQALITSTPVPDAFFIDFEKEVAAGNTEYAMRQGSMFDNPFLPKSFINHQLKKYGNTRRGRQELYGHLLKDVPGAFWSEDLIERQRLTYDSFKARIRPAGLAKDGIPIGLPEEFEGLDILRVVVGVDPAVTSKADSDETGIVVVMLLSDYKIYVVADYSGKYTPNEWANKTIAAYNEWEADAVICETNNGGDLVINNIKTAVDGNGAAIGRFIPVSGIHASKAKIVRFEPIASLFESDQAYLVGNYPDMEQQLLTFTGDPKQSSPDRLDAMCIAATELTLEHPRVETDFSGLGTY